MTKAKIFALIRFYRKEIFLQTALEPKFFPRNRILSEKYFDEAVPHALAKLQLIESELRSKFASVNDAQAELRVVQTILWVVGLYTEEQIEAHNKNPV